MCIIHEMYESTQSKHVDYRYVKDKVNSYVVMCIPDIPEVLSVI